MDRDAVTNGAAKMGVLVRLTRLAVGAAALLSAVGGMVLLASADLPHAQIVGTLAPFAFAAALLVVLAAAALRVSKVALAAALAGALAHAAFVAPELVAAAEPNSAAVSDSVRLKIVSANVWSLNRDPALFEDFVRREQPDVIIVQEAFGRWSDMLLRLAPEYQVQAGCLGRACNVAILSRLPFVDDGGRPTHQFARARLQLPDGRGVIEVAGVHLARRRTEALEERQLDEVRSIADSLGPRGILAGDFNATPWSPMLRRLDGAIPLDRRTHALLSWPTPSRPFTRWRLRMPAALTAIDHIYAGRAWRTVEVRRGPDIGSDHYPVIATLALQ